jgi:hypothetical protein
VRVSVCARVVCAVRVGARGPTKPWQATPPREAKRRAPRARAPAAPRARPAPAPPGNAAPSGAERALNAIWGPRTFGCISVDEIAVSMMAMRSRRSRPPASLGSSIVLTATGVPRHSALWTCLAFFPGGRVYGFQAAQLPAPAGAGRPAPPPPPPPPPHSPPSHPPTHPHPQKHTHARTHTHARAHTHCTHALQHTHCNTHAHTHTQVTSRAPCRTTPPPGPPAALCGLPPRSCWARC